MKEVKAIEIEINSHCNRACSYCPNVNQARLEQGLMSKELFDKILVQLKAINYQERISFSFYNEPLLSPDLDYFSREVKKYLPKTNLLIYSNGSLLTKSKLDNLISAGVDYFVITKHENEENFVFDQTLRDLSSDFVQKYIQYQSHTELKLTNRGGLLPKIVKTIETINLPCTIPLHMMTITNQGSIIPCFEDYHQVHSMGNVNLNSLEEIWSSKEYSEFRKKILFGMRRNYEVCSKCNRTEMLGIY
jgi:radical SAM protein with 4Fe4S-binding SPASM domain